MGVKNSSLMLQSNALLFKLTFKPTVRSLVNMGSKSYILGVDPGASGALCLLAPGSGIIVKVWDFPLTEHFGKKVIDCGMLAAELKPHFEDIQLCVIEDVHSMPMQGVASTFSFGVSKGVILGMIAAHFIPTFTPPPAIWKMTMGVTKDKASSLKKASELYPTYAHLWPKKGDDGKAEAVLLADFGRRFFKSEKPNNNYLGRIMKSSPGALE